MRANSFFRSPGIACGCAAMLIVLAAHSARAAGPAAISISNFTFVPAEITVHAGAAVTFTNADDIPHLVVADDGSFRSKALDSGNSFTFTFAKAGTFAYFCALHPHMQGKVIVVP
jgi:plastocyanin